MSNKIDFSSVTGDIANVNNRKESKRLVEKWDRVGLLKGLKDTGSHSAKSNMARLLENQAAQLLRESSEVGDIKGFQNIAFPIVRRVFGGLIANELVSVQPMSLPSGLLFFLDYTFANRNKAGNQKLDWTANGSLYGDQTSPGTENLGTGGHYYMNSSYSNRELTAAFDVQASGAATWAQVNYDFELSGAVASNTLWYADVMFTSSAVTLASLDETNYKNFSISGSSTQWSNIKNVFKRHNTLNASTGLVRLFYSASTNATPHMGGTPVGPGITGSYVTKSGLTVDSTGVVYSPVFESDFATDMIPEIDIKVSSVAVTAQTRKLKAKWTPELAQDLNAYHNLDAEVELTQILSEQIALDIDREILSQLLNDATGATMYWSRVPGNFVNKLTGVDVAGSFTGTVREWYELFVETCIDVSNTIHRKTLRGAANFMVVSPDVATILEACVLYKPQLSLDPKETQFSLGIEKVGSLSNRFTVYKDPYFPRNQVLIGYKGNSFLETGFVYAPYVPLIVTPTIFAPDDFTPRKGVMTRYAKKMVRSDFYGKVVVLRMDVI
jgi:hypothetical protein